MLNVKKNGNDIGVVLELLGRGLPAFAASIAISLDLTRKESSVSGSNTAQRSISKNTDVASNAEHHEPSCPIDGQAMREGNVAVPANKVPNNDTVSVAKENVFATPSLSGKAVSKFPIDSISKMKKAKATPVNVGTNDDPIDTKSVVDSQQRYHEHRVRQVQGCRAVREQQQK